MSANPTTLVAAATTAKPDEQRRHRTRLLVAWLLVLATFLALAAYGADYYRLRPAERPFSPKHAALQPSGTVGIKLGVIGVVMFFGLFVYALRKHWPWLRKRGQSQHWLDYHVLLGIAAPLCVAFHSSFKFRGIAGFSFWVMMVVAVSGFVGRYLYSQIPRQVSAAELSLRESHELQLKLAWALASQRLLSVQNLQPMLFLPTLGRALTWPWPTCLFHMVKLDLQRPLQVARLRRRVLSTREKVLTMGGLLPSRDSQAERVIALARKQAALSKRIVFFARAQQIFRLWHVVHKPFSYTFAVLVVVHIAVAMVLGFV